MTNSKDVNGKRCLANPFGLTHGSQSCKLNETYDDSTPPRCFIRLNDDLTVSVSIYSAKSGYMWQAPQKLEDIKLPRVHLSMAMGTGWTYGKEALYLIVKDKDSGKHLKNVHIGQVYEISHQELIVMPTPSEDPLVQLLHQYGLRESDIEVTATPREDVEMQFRETTAAVCGSHDNSMYFVQLPNGASRLFISPDLKEGLGAIKHFLCGVVNGWRVLRKPTWLLVAEMNLAGKLGPEVRMREEVIALVKAEVEALAAKCHQLTATDKHLECVADFFSYRVPYKVKRLVEEAFPGARKMLQEGGFEPAWAEKKIRAPIYHATMRCDLGDKFSPVFSYNSEDVDKTVRNITEGLKKL